MIKHNRRFSPEEDSFIRADYHDYVDVHAMAIKLGRDWGTVRQRIYQLKLKRDRNVSRMLKWCPEHLKPVLKEQGASSFIEAINAYAGDVEQNESKLSTDAKAQLDARIDEIAARPELERKDKMLAMRALGATLEQIGQRFEISHERVRQLTDPDFYPTKPKVAQDGSMENLLAINARMEQKIAANKDRIKTKAIGTMKACWGALDEDARQEFIDYIESKP